MAEHKTPPRGKSSDTHAVYSQACLELAAKLRRPNQPVGNAPARQALATRLDGMRARFDAWPANPPDTETRRAAIDEVLEVYEKVRALTD